MRIKYRDIWNSIIEVNNTLHLYEGFLLNLGIKHPELYVKLKWIYHKIRRK